jgi:hypothetical protein
MSKARAIRNKPTVCLVFLFKMNADAVPPISPAISKTYLLQSVFNTLLNPHIIPRITTKNPHINSPNLIESLLIKMSIILIGFFFIFLRLSTKDTATFIK